MNVRRILVLTALALWIAAIAAPARAHDRGDLDAALEETESALREATEALAGLELPDLEALVEPASSGPATLTERTVEVKRGSTLELSSFAGDIVVHAGPGNRVRVTARHSPRERVTIHTEGSKVIVDCESDRMVPASVHYEIVVPEWMNLDLSGVNSDIAVEGVKGRVKAETVQGGVDLIDTSGWASIGSVQGGVRVERSRGRVEASAINGPVQVFGAGGAIVAESVNGEITLRDVASDSVDASTVNGPVRFAGKLLSRGLYRLASHNGSIRIAVPEDASARVRVATYRGGFDCSFPVAVHETKKGREYELKLGSGGADVTLETFQGWVILRRPGEADDEDDAHSRVRDLKQQLRKLEWKERDRESGEDD